jgi:hypothetical protein
MLVGSLSIDGCIDAVSNPLLQEIPMNKLLPALVLGAFLAAQGPVFAQPAKPAEPPASAAKSDQKADQKTEAKKEEPKKKKEKKGGC